MGDGQLRGAIDAGDVKALRDLLQDEPSLDPAIYWAREQGRPKAVAHLAARGAA